MPVIKLPLLVLIAHFSLLPMACSQETNDQSTQSTGYENIDVPTFDELRVDSEYVVIDVRTPEECAEGIVDGAIQIDFFSNDFGKKLDSLDRNARYLLYCRSGRRSAKAAAQMKELGFKHISNLEGGYLKWSESHQ